jgi:hypothetical protein
MNKKKPTLNVGTYFPSFIFGIPLEGTNTILIAWLTIQIPNINLAVEPRISNSIFHSLNFNCRSFLKIPPSIRVQKT